MGADYHSGELIYEYQPPALLDQAAPIQNQWYTVLEETNVRVYKAASTVMTVGENLEMQIHIDGELIEGAATPVGAGVTFLAHLYANASTLLDFVFLSSIAGVNYYGPAFLVEGKEVKIEVRKTTAAGAGNLRAIVMWGKKVVKG